MIFLVDYCSGEVIAILILFSNLKRECVTALVFKSYIISQAH